MSLLRLKNICKTYHDTKALKNISFELERGQVCVLLGSNGAGKSTLTRILAGEEKPTSGSVYLDGKMLEFSSPYAAKKQGIISCSQNIMIFDELTITENLFLGSELYHRGHLLDWERMRGITAEMLNKFHIDASPLKKCGQLSLAEKYLIQFSRILINDYKLVILDELTDSLTMSEVDIVYRSMKEMKERGCAIIYITHRIEEALRVGDVICTMKDGEITDFTTVSRAKKDKIAQKMLGKDIKNHYPKLSVKQREVVLRVKNVRNKFLNDISFSLRRGEILGIAGLVGSGRTSLLKAIVGLSELDHGSVEVVSSSSAEGSRLKRRNIGYMPENRDEQGLFRELSVAQNITIKGLNSISRFNMIQPHKEDEVGADMVYRLGIKVKDIHQSVLRLSGGNKQKTLVARSVFSKSNIYVFDEPTKGVDIAGKVEIYNIINDLVRKGAAIVLVSSDFSELAGMCDRVLVIKKGNLVAELNQTELSQQVLFSLIKE